jgi:lipopolysaccharide/colanic/teichoic acid biosynthesis glycosyltransferase
LAFKRATDFILSGAAILALAPLIALVAFVIKTTTPGPVFFRQERAGRGGRPFFIWKFRTMVKDAADKGPAITGAGDPRITRVGYLLRLTKLDELPNLVNVFKGEMSLVGPRPDLPRFMMTLTPTQRRIFDFRPGLTGPTQIRYIAEEELLSPINIDDDYVENVLQDKLASDLAYVERWTWWRDIVLILYTVVALLFKVLGRLTRTFHPRNRSPRSYKT